MAARYGLDLEQRADFERWVELLRIQSRPGAVLLDGMVPATYQWVVADGQYCGAIVLRHLLSPVLAELGGHVGYAVRPSARRQGLAGFALTAMLPRASRLGLEQIMVTCEESNVGSRKTIEKAGGALHDIRTPDTYSAANGFNEPVCRYWISCAEP